MEYNCLMMFVRNPNKALTKRAASGRSLGRRIRRRNKNSRCTWGRIRKKLGWQDRIKTIPRIGYRLEVEF
ncbi:MAG: helix-turn-helix domain-containing protein [Ruminococcus sp.]